MSARSRSRGPAAPPGRPPRRHRGAPRARWWFALALLATVVAIALLRRREAPAPDPLAGLPARAAADSADRLMDRGLYAEALPYVQHLERLAGNVIDAAFEARVANLVTRASFQVRPAGGLLIPKTRSSIERVALMSHALQRLDAAERKAESRDLVRDVIVGRARQLAVWGFVRESYLEFRRAASVGELPPRVIGEARWVEQMLGDPTSQVPEPPLDSLAAPGPDGAPR